MRRPAFSFVEVLFAVMILGVGFILIAAIFPVSLAQSKATNEETAGAMIARGATATIDEIATQQLMKEPASPTEEGVRSFASSTDLYKAIGGNLIQTADPRRAWVPFFRRDTGWSYAQIFLLPVEVRNRTSFSSREDVMTSTSELTTKAVTITSSDPTAQTVTIAAPPSGFSNGLTSAVEGAFLVLQYDPGNGSNRPKHYMTGRVYKIGAPTGTVNQWYLAPGADMQLDPGPDGVVQSTTSASGVVTVAGDDVLPIPANLTAWIVGKGYNNAAAGFSVDGPAQDISIYTTFVNLR